MGKKILIILTSEDKLGNTGNPTGWYLPELAHPYKALKDAGFEMEAVSPKGGKAPLVSEKVKLILSSSNEQFYISRDPL